MDSVFVQNFSIFDFLLFFWCNFLLFETMGPCELINLVIQLSAKKPRKNSIHFLKFTKWPPEVTLFFLWKNLQSNFSQLNIIVILIFFYLLDKFFLATADGTANGIGSSSGGVCDRHNMKIQIRVSEVTGKWFYRFTGYQSSFYWQKVIRKPWFSDFKMSAHWNFQILTTLDIRVRSSPRLTNESLKFPAYGCLRSRRFSLDLMKFSK